MAGSQVQDLERPQFKAETADDLRELITQAELIVANLRGARARAQKLLFLMDTIQDLMARLQETGVDLRAEATRVETVERILLAKDSVLVSEMARQGGLTRFRELVKPAPGQWWWYLDNRVAERQRALLRKGLFVAGGLLVALLIFHVLYTYGPLRPDPKQVAAMDKTGKAEQALQQGDVAQALVYYREAAEILPEDIEICVWVGVLEERLGNAEAASQAYAQAEQLAGDRAVFLYTRGTAYQQLGALDLAEADAQAALELRPDYAEGYFLLAGVYESRGDAARAIDAFEKAAAYAEQKNNSALVVMAKYRMGMLMQSAPAMMPGSTTPTPGS